MSFISHAPTYDKLAPILEKINAALPHMEYIYAATRVTDIRNKTEWGRREDDIGATLDDINTTLDDTFYHMKNAIIMQKFL